MLGRKKKAAAVSSDGPTKFVTLELVADDGSFEGDEAEIVVRGFDIYNSGNPLGPVDDGPVLPGLFMFKLAGITHHPDSNLLDGDALSQILVRHRPDNPHDSNAVEVLTQDGGRLAGYVPASLAPKMRPYLSTGIVQGKQVTGSVGIVTKTFHKNGNVCGAQVVVAAEGFQIQFRSR